MANKKRAPKDPNAPKRPRKAIPGQFMERHVRAVLDEVGVDFNLFVRLYKDQSSKKFTLKPNEREALITHGSDLPALLEAFEKLGSKPTRAYRALAEATAAEGTPQPV